MRTRPSAYLYRVILAASVAIVAIGILGCISFATPTPTSAPLTAETPTPVVIVVTATPVAPTPTSTSIPSALATSTPSPAPGTATATGTATKAPTGTPVPVKPTAAPPAPSPTPQCQELPIRGFGKVWIENVTARDYVGCPSYPKSETGVDIVAQRFEKGIIFFTKTAGFPGADSVMVLFRDDKTWSKVVASLDAVPGAIGSPPAGKYAPSGRIGWVWQQAAGVRSRLGWATEPEKSGGVTDGVAAWQAFSRGSMFWIKFNDPDDRWIFVVATYKPYPPGGNRSDWLEFKDTWNP